MPAVVSFYTMANAVRKGLFNITIKSYRASTWFVDPGAGCVSDELYQRTFVDNKISARWFIHDVSSTHSHVNESEPIEP